MGTPFHNKHEFTLCRCGEIFERALRRSGRVKKLCPRCEANRKYQLKKRRAK